MKKFLFVLLLLVFFTACTASVEVNLKDDISGTISVVVNVNKEFEKIRKELLTTLMGEEIAAKPLFPVDDIKKYFSNEEKESGFNLLSIKTHGDSISMIIKFNNLAKTIKNYMSKTDMPILNVESKNGKNIIELDINLENVTKIINENKEHMSDVLAALLPSSEVPMTEQEYKDVLIYFLSSFTSNASELIDSSKLILRVKIFRRVQEQFGFKQIGLNILGFDINMAKGLSLEKPIKLRLIY